MLPVIVISISCVKLCKCLTGSAITVFCWAIQALSKGKVVGNGKGDKSCFCVFSCCNSCNKRINSIRTEAKPPQPLAPPLQKEKKIVHDISFTNFWIYTVSKKLLFCQLKYVDKHFFLFLTWTPYMCIVDAEFKFG